MRKNFRLFNKIKGLTYQTFLVSGLNREFLLNKLKKSGVNVYNVKRKSAKQTLVTLPYNHVEKFFAITKELCYNVKKVNSSGRYYPIIQFFSRTGIVLGLAFFMIFASVSSNFVFKISYHGSGAKYSREVSAYLNSAGVKKYSKYSSLNLKELSLNIVSSLPFVSFAECTRRGGELRIYLVENKNETGINSFQERLSAEVDGEIAEIKVYRGVALKKKGDKVKAGEILISGETEVNDKVINTGVLAFVKIKTQKIFTFVSEKDGQEEIFLSIAKSSLPDTETISESVIVENKNQEFVYTAVIEFYHTTYSGL